MSFAYLEHLSDACLVTNEQDEIIFWNNSFLLLGELKEREIKKMRLIDQLISFDDEITDLSVECGFRFFNHKIGFGLVRKVSVDQTRITIIRDLSVEKSLHQKYHAQLEELRSINRNLEMIVSLRTEELRRSNKYLFDLLDSFNQAIFMVNLDGKIETSKALNLSIVLKKFPEHLQDLFSVSQPHDQTDKWLKLLFAEALPFEEMAPLVPQELVIEDQTFKMNYYPSYNSENRLDAIVVAMTNITSEVKVKIELEVKNKMAASLLKASQAGNRFILAMEEISELLESLLKIGIDEDFFRAKLHALKGIFSYYGPIGFDQDIHEIEILNAGLPHKQARLDTISKIFEDKLKEIVSLLPQFKSGNKLVQQNDLSEIYKSHDLQEVKSLLLPYVFLDVLEVCQSMREYVQELSLGFGKHLSNFQVDGERLYLSNEVFLLLNQFLIQGLRNSVAHGFAQNEIDNNIFINTLESDQRLLIQIKTEGKISKENKKVTILSGLNQGQKLLEQLALQHEASIKLEINEESGVSLFKLYLPLNYRKG